MSLLVATGFATMAFMLAGCVNKPTNPSKSPTGETSATSDAVQFRDLLELMTLATYRIEYKVEGRGDEAATSFNNGRFIWYADPPRSRIDVVVEDTTVISFLDTPDSAVYCSLGNCQDLFPGQLTETGVEEFLNLANKSRITGRSDRTIAARAARCFALEATERIRFERGEMCFDENGLPLLMEGGLADGSDGGVLTAVEVEDSVLPAVFERSAVGASAEPETPVGNPTPSEPALAAIQADLHARGLVVEDFPAGWRAVPLGVNDVREPYCKEGYNEGLSKARANRQFITTGYFVNQSLIPFSSDAEASQYLSTWRESVEACKAELLEEGVFLDVFQVPFAEIGDEVVSIRLNNLNTNAEIQDVVFRDGSVVVVLYYIARAPNSVSMEFIESLAATASNRLSPSQP